ncbi:pyridoxamine 5'-phosphate oxidase family protein [Phycisphaeraceae bacterium D3-23]
MTTPELGYDEVLRAARRLVQRRVVGAMSTCDAAGQPHTRWMAGVAIGEGLSRLLSVTARGSRKLDQLADNPRVCWLFSDAHDDEVVTLTGTVSIIEDQSRVEPVWRRLEPAARLYAMNLLSEPENLWFVGLETTVETVEYMHPAAGLTHPVIHRLR